MSGPFFIIIIIQLKFKNVKKKNPWTCSTVPCIGVVQGVFMVKVFAVQRKDFRKHQMFLASTTTKDNYFYWVIFSIDT